MNWQEVAVIFQVFHSFNGIISGVLRLIVNTCTQNEWAVHIRNAWPGIAVPSHRSVLRVPFHFVLIPHFSSVSVFSCGVFYLFNKKLEQFSQTKYRKSHENTWAQVARIWETNSSIPRQRRVFAEYMACVCVCVCSTFRLTTPKVLLKYLCNLAEKSLSFIIFFLSCCFFSCTFPFLFVHLPPSSLSPPPPSPLDVLLCAFQVRLGMILQAYKNIIVVFYVILNIHKYVFLPILVGITRVTVV